MTTLSGGGTFHLRFGEVKRCGDPDQRELCASCHPRRLRTLCILGVCRLRHHPLDTPSKTIPNTDIRIAIMPTKRTANALAKVAKGTASTPGSSKAPARGRLWPARSRPSTTSADAETRQYGRSTRTRGQTASSSESPIANWSMTWRNSDPGSGTRADHRLMTPSSGGSRSGPILPASGTLLFL